MTKKSETLRISEIFFSLQGEALTTGVPTVFVRLTGCPLRCQYCDTSYAFTGGKLMTISDILDEVGIYGIEHVTVTGGEPLAQKNCNEMMSLLCDRGYKVSIETSGALSLEGIDARVVKVMDLKTPGSGEVSKNLYENLDLISDQDQVKFVVCNEPDYDWCKEIIEKHHLSEKCQVLLSPSHEELAPGQLADWILRDRLPVRFQIQLHKYLWGDVPGR